MNRLKPPIEKGFSFYSLKHGAGLFFLFTFVGSVAFHLRMKTRCNLSIQRVKILFKSPLLSVPVGSMLTHVLGHEILLHKGTNPG